MTRYKLPDWLGGHTYDAVHDIHIDQLGDSIQLIVPGIGDRWFFTADLAEVPPPAPPEPPHGTVIRETRTYSSVFESINLPEQHNGDHHWFRSGGRRRDNDPSPQHYDGFTWDEVWARIYRGYITLIEDPVASAPELPWELADPNRPVDVAVHKGAIQLWAGDPVMHARVPLKPDEATAFAHAILRAARECAQ